MTSAIRETQTIEIECGALELENIRNLCECHKMTPGQLLHFILDEYALGFKNNHKKETK